MGLIPVDLGHGDYLENKGFFICFLSSHTTVSPLLNLNRTQKGKDPTDDTMED